jgi:uncharacterized membrane protein
MKILKVTLIVLVVIIGLLLITGLFTKKEFGTEVSIIIDKPNELVFDYVKYLKNQENYSKWETMDPNMEKYYKGTDGTAGFIAGWKSEKKDVGEGEQEIMDIEEGKRIDYELRFKEPFEATNTAYIAFESIDENQTKVSWGFSGGMNYPMNIMMLFMDIEGEVAKDFEFGLNRLKTILESMETEIPEDEDAEQEVEEVI